MARIHHLAAVAGKECWRQTLHHVAAMRRERDVAAARVLSGNGPLRLAVTRQDDAWHGRGCHRAKEKGEGGWRRSRREHRRGRGDRRALCSGGIDKKKDGVPPKAVPQLPRGRPGACVCVLVPACLSLSHTHTHTSGLLLPAAPRPSAVCCLSIAADGVGKACAHIATRAAATSASSLCVPSFVGGGGPRRAALRIDTQTRVYIHYTNSTLMYTLLLHYATPTKVRVERCVSGQTSGIAPGLGAESSSSVV